MGRCGVVLLVVSLVTVVAVTALPPGHAAGGGDSPRNTIDDAIIEALENFRDQMPDGWPDLGIPPLDPLTLGFVSLNVSENTTKLEGSLSEVVINNLSTFNIDLVHVKVLSLELDVALGIPLLDIAGNYDLTGQSGSFPLYGDGPFTMDGVNVTLDVVGKMGASADGFLVTDLNITLDLVSTNIDFEGMLGGGEMGDFVNDLLSDMGPSILHSLEDEYMPWLEDALIHEINQILSGATKKQPRDQSVDDYFDRVFANMRQFIKENGQDPLPLPGDADNFTITLFNQTLSGGVEAGPGKLGGLSTVHRAGDMDLLYVGDQDEIIWKGEVGLIDLQVDYRLALTFPLLGEDLGITAKLSFIHLSFETDAFLDQSEITFAYCNVTELGPIHFKESSGGLLDPSIYDIIINALLGELAGTVSSAVEGAVCTLLEDAFASS